MYASRGEGIAALLDTAFAPAASLPAWLDRLTAQLAHLARAPLGSVGRLVDTRGANGPQLACPYSVHVASDRLSRAIAYHQHASKHRVDLVRGRPGLRPMRPLMERLAPRDPYVQHMLARFDQVGSREMHHLTIVDCTGQTLTLGVLSATTGRLELPRVLWSVLEDHLATAFRLQLRLSRDSSDSLRYALGPPSPHDPTLEPRVALAVWAGIVTGTWSVIDRHDEGGQRFLLAVPADPDRRDARGLLHREAQIAALTCDGYSEKEIAYAMGLARSTVAGLLRDALRKLHIPSRIALAGTFQRSSMHYLEPLALTGYARPGGAVLLVFDLPLSGCDAPHRLPSQLRARLTPGQLRVAELALQGLSDLEIAKHTRLSRHTVANQLRNAYRRVGVRSRTELAAVARSMVRGP